MSRKKAPQTQYIAVNMDCDKVIAVGNREEVTRAIQVYIDMESLDQDEIYVKIFELGPEKALHIETQIEVSF
jgi:hypothetical protein